MKKIIFQSVLLCIAYLCIGHKCNAQIDRSDAQTYITNYQDNTNHYPSCFLVNASQLQDLLDPLPTDGVYLHVYFADWYRYTYNPFIILVRTLKNTTQGTYMHDYSRKVLASGRNDYNTCITYDNDLDGNEHFDIDCNVPEYFTGNLLNSIIANKYIYNYQNHHRKCPIEIPNCQGPNYEHTQSFFIEKAGLIRQYLIDNPNIYYVQVYIGKNPALDNTDKLTLVLVGVKEDGTHVYFNNTQVFDECNPCPRCAVDPDVVLDNEPQLVFNAVQKTSFQDAKKHKKRRKQY